MSLFGSLFSAVAKVALTPVTIISDVVDCMDGEPPVSTVANLYSAGKDVVKATGSVLDGNLMDDDEDLSVNWD